MTTKFSLVWDEAIDSDGDDSLVGQEVFSAYNSMNPKTPLEWTTQEEINTNPIIHTVVSVLDQRLRYFQDCYFCYDIQSLEDVDEYLNDILNAVYRNGVGLVMDILNWAKKSNLINEASINELNDFLSSTTKTTTQPYAVDSDGKPIWSNATTTYRNSDFFIIPDNKWIEMPNFNKIVNELSTIIYNII